VAELRDLTRGVSAMAAAVLLAAVAACGGGSAATAATTPSPAVPAVSAPSAGQTATVLHYAANGNLDSVGLRPQALGFDLADVATRAELDALPAGVKGLVYLGLCAGADASFRARVDAFAGDQRLYGFYLLDEPDPATCPAANLAAESAYIHARQPGIRTFLLVQNLASSKNPSFAGGYDRTNTGVDLFGISPYPCRSELHGCDYPMIGRYVAAAERAGIPASAIVPVYQAFGGGSWVDDGGGQYLLPTAAEASRMITEWSKIIPHPPFDYAYSWGGQRGDDALGTASAALQQVFASHNRG
jgi:hypothetical protein